MILSVLDRKLVRDLWHMRGQALTIALVVACGIGAFVAQLATYDSLQWQRSTYYDDTRFAHVFAEVKRVPLPVARRIAELPGVAQLQTGVVADVTLDLPGVAEPVIGRMIGLADGAPPQLNRLTLRKGRWPEAGRASEALVSEAFAKARSIGPGDAVFALLNGKRERLDIVGVALSPEYVFSARGGGLPDDRGFGVFWIDGERLASAFQMKGAFNHVAVRLAPGANERDVIAGLDRVLAPWGAFGAYGRDEQTSHRILTQEINQQRSMAAVFPTVFLLVAAFLLNVVLARQVATQREQIAALKALGYGDAAIGAHYLKLVLAILGIGVLAGLALGAVLGRYMTEMYAMFFHFPHPSFRVQAWIPLTATAVSVAAAVAGALGTVRGVVRLAPAEAMRPPAPARYRRMLLERMGLEHLVSAQTRMVVRILERRPLRTLLIAAAIASSVAVIVAGTFWRDAFDYLLAVQFQAMQREDVSIAFQEPVESASLAEIRHMPGVLAAEPGRAASVRLVAGHRSYRTGILGVPDEARLRRLLDEDLREVVLPGEGLLLSDRLADRLHLAPGDRVTVEFQEGRRLRREALVAGVVQDLLGLTAYMDLRALNRLMQEGDTVSNVNVSIDAREIGALYAKLKATPAVATVTTKGEALRAVRETTERNILFFTAIVSLFAAAIAVGVVYNSARISLAERAWELASLRVLGFTRGEVSGLLLGELAFELLAAIPLGLFLGWALSWFIIVTTHTETVAIPFVIQPRTYAWAALVTLAAGVVSAMLVRHRVDHLDLVAVLKTRE